MTRSEKSPIDWPAFWRRYLRTKRRDGILRGLPPPRDYGKSFVAFIKDRWSKMDHDELTKKRYNLIYGKDSEFRLLREFLTIKRVPEADIVAQAHAMEKLETFYVATQERKLLYNDLFILADRVRVPTIEKTIVKLLEREKDDEAHGYALRKLKPEAIAKNEDHPLAVHVLAVAEKGDAGALSALYEAYAARLLASSSRCDRCRRRMPKGESIEGCCESCYGEMWDRGFESSSQRTDEMED